MIGLYTGVTEEDKGKVTGNLVNSSNKITVTLNSSIQEMKDILVAIRTISEEHKTIGSTTLAFEGVNADKWCFADPTDSRGETFLGWGEPLVIEEEIRYSNKILKIKVRSLENESVQSDNTVSIKVTGVIGTVA